MEILYLSSLCTLNEYHRMFELYGTTSSHASQKFHRLFVNGLNANGMSVSTLSTRVIANPNLDDLEKEDEEENGIVYHYLPHCKYVKYNRFFSIWKTYVFLKEWLKKHQNTMIISDTISGESSIALYLFKIFHKVNTVGLVLDVPAKRANENRRGIKAIPFLIKNSLISIFDGYIFLTEQMNSYLNSKKKPYCVIEGIAEKPIIINTLEGKHEKRVIMMAGLLEKTFGVDELLEAFSKLDDKNIELRFYGRGSSVNTILNYSNKDERIKFMGETTNDVILQEEIKSTILVNPRTAEGEWTAYSFPSKNIEYIASGTPMIAYNLPCIPNEYLSYFFPISNLKDTLSYVLSLSNYELHSFGMKAQNWIAENKNSKKQTQKVCKMLEILERR